MLCEICHENDATIHINEIINGQKKALHICSSCAAKQDKSSGLDFGSFNLAEMLYNLEKLGAEVAPGKPKKALPSCPACGWDLGKIRESGGRLGCPACYRAFAGPIREALENVHRGQTHLGKRPGASGGDGAEGAALRMELNNLRRRLDELVKAENYEEAASVRDRIRTLTVELDGNPAPENPPEK